MTTSNPTVPAQERLLTARFITLALGDLAYFTAVGVAIYALPFFVTGPIGSDKAGAGLAFGAFAITALLLRPIAGRLTDRIGRQPLLIGGAALCAVTMALTAFADSLAQVIALRLLLGVAEAAFFVSSFAALADLAPASRLGEAMSYNSLGLYLGLALGPPLGELLVRVGGFPTAWWGAGVLALLATVCMCRLGETAAPKASHDSPPASLIHRKALAPALGFFASVVAMGGFLTFAVLRAESVGLTSTSLVLFVYGAVVVTCRLVFAKVPDRVPGLTLGAGALATIAAGLAVTALWSTAIGLLIGTVILAIGVSFSTPAFFAAVFSVVRPAERGSAAGTISVFLDLGLGGGPILLGLVAQGAGINAMFGAAAAVALAGCAWTVSISSRSSRLASPSKAQ